MPCARPQKNKNKNIRVSGYGMAEILVGIVISMLSMLVIVQTYALFEGQKRTTSSGEHAQENGMLSLHLLETDIRMAGYGLVANGAFNCTAVNTYNAGATALNTPTAPVMITDGGNGSDTISITYSNSSVGGAPASIVQTMPDSSAVMTVNQANGFNVNDLVWVSTPGSGLPCSQLQITGLHTQSKGVNIIHNSGQSPYNPPGGQNIFPSQGYGTLPPSVVYDMGSLVNNRYQILCNNLTLTNLVTTNGSASCTSASTFTNATSIASNIVALQAQYGIAPSGNQSVTCWVNATNGGNPCDGDNWAAPSATDMKRIKAIRIGIVARSSLPEKNNVSKTCVSASGNVNKGPCLWPDTPNNPAPMVDLSANPSWQRYRYQVYQTIIPLRNVLWGNL